MPNARMPRMWVTVLASQPSVSIETDTTQRMSSPSRSGLADRVDHLAQDVLVADVVRAAAGEPGDVLALELVDLAGGGLLEGGVEGVAPVELRGVHQERSPGGRASGRRRRC